MAEDDAYDYLLVDCPPAFSASCAATLYAADEVIIPTSIGQYEEWGVANLTRQIDGMLSVNPQLHLGGLLVTMWHNAPLVVQGIFDIIREINRQGVTILLIEQNANMALKIADLAYVLETGTITMSGTGAELLADEKVKEAYLGKKRGK